METFKGRRPIRTKKLVTFEASEAWIEWVDGLAEKVGTSRSTTIDQALRRLAEALRYEAKPPKR